LRLRLALLLLVAAGLAGCGGSRTSAPEQIVRAWIRAVNVNDNEAAANLFAPNAEVVQPGHVFVLHTHADAFLFNSALPCAGRIVALSIRGQTATATFSLGNRLRSRCGTPGQEATAMFTVQRGKIVLWHQLPTRIGATPQPI
jgi:limonene-1,2-epoxide hydrolase